MVVRYARKLFFSTAGFALPWAEADSRFDSHSDTQGLFLLSSRSNREWLILFFM